MIPCRSSFSTFNASLNRGAEGELVRDLSPRATPRRATSPRRSSPYAYTAPVNTGVPSRMDLDNNGSIGGGNDTANFNEPPGNIRVDYALPSRNLVVRDSQVFWPTSDDPLARLTGTYPFPTSDHRLVWVDIHVPH